MRTRIGIVGVCIAFLATAAGAQPIFFATQGTSFYRISGGVVETFTMGADLTSMAVAPNGTIWGAAVTNADGDAFREIYTVANPLGTPSLVLQGDFLEDNTPALTFIDGTMYGLQKPQGAPGSDAKLYTIDTGAQTQTLVGATGTVGEQVAGFGYDPGADELYGVAFTNEPTGDLTTVDYDLDLGTDPAATVIANIPVNYTGIGSEFWEGVLYSVLQDNDSNEFRLGTVNTSTGAFDEILVVDALGAVGTSLAIIPEPGSIGIFGILLLAAVRRRR